MKKNIQRLYFKFYVQRWNEGHSIELKELRKTTPQAKFRQFLSLMSSNHLFGSPYLKLKEINTVLKRWNILRKGWPHAT